MLALSPNVSSDFTGEEDRGLGPPSPPPAPAEGSLCPGRPDDSYGQGPAPPSEAEARGLKGPSGALPGPTPTRERVLSLDSSDIHPLDDPRGDPNALQHSSSYNENFEMLG